MGEKIKRTQGPHGQEKFCWEFFWRKAQDTDEEKVGREGETPSHFGISQRRLLHLLKRQLAWPSVSLTWLIIVIIRTGCKNIHSWVPPPRLS